MSEAVQAEFIVESEGDDWQPQHIHFTGWEDVVFEVEEEVEWPWS